MDPKDWILLLAGAIIGYFVSIVANLSTPSFGGYFSRGKAGWIERSKRRALKQFDFIQKFRSGREDRYMYFVARWGYILLYSLFTTFFAIVYLDAGTLATKYLALVGVFFTLMRGMWVHFDLYLWYWRINNFEIYRNSLQKKWPDLNLPE